jgi:MFS family permease
MSTVASLPFFLFTLPAGALADKVDRRKLICFVNTGLAAMAAGLAALGWAHFLNPYITLVSVFSIGLLKSRNQQEGLPALTSASRTWTLICLIPASLKKCPSFIPGSSGALGVSP